MQQRKQSDTWSNTGLAWLFVMFLAAYATYIASFGLFFKKNDEVFQQPADISYK